LATVHQRHRQNRADRLTGQTGQRSDSTGRTVLGTVAQPVNIWRSYRQQSRLSRAMWSVRQAVSCWKIKNLSEILSMARN